LHAARLLDRDRFQLWLQLSFGRILPLLSAVMRASLTPHSFRAGRAGDLARARVRKELIQRLGQYIRDGLAQLVSLREFEVIMDCGAFLNALDELLRSTRSRGGR
jgi:hypothetical protein